MSTLPELSTFDLNEGHVLERAVQAMSERFNALIGACLDDKGQPVAPTRAALDLALDNVPVLAPSPAFQVDDRRILDLAFKAMSRHFHEFVSACLDDKGQPIAPPRKALMQARACLPPSCVHAFPAKDSKTGG